MAAINHPSQQQQYCLQWKSFHTNMSDVFQNMLVHENLVDVTLACEGASIKAHKMILAACSPYFQNLFMTNPCKHPIVILKDVKFNDLKSIIDFIYSGEVNIPQDQLTSLLKTAETLKIKGLDNFGERQLPNHHHNHHHHLGKNSIPLNYSSFNLGKKRKRPRTQFTHVNNNNNNNPSAINNSPHKTTTTTFNKINSNNNVQPNNNNSKEVLTTTTTTNGDNGDSSDDECNNSSKSASIDKSYYSSNVPSPNFNNNNNNNNNKNSNNNSTTPNNNNNNLFENDNEREDSEEFEPTKLLEQSMSTPENTGVDYSPENNGGDEPSGDEDENEDNKEFIREDDYSSNNSNTDNLVLPVGINFNRFITAQTNQNDGSINNNNNNNNNNVNGNANSRSIEEYETLLSEIQQKNLTTCPICSKEFIKKSKLIRHYHTHFSDFRPKFSCVFCGKLFTTQDWCKRHALNCQLKHYQHVSQMSPYLND